MLVRGICEGLGVEEAVTSPSYTLQNIYETPGGARIFHLDCFRLSGAAELEDLGIEDQRDEDTIVLVEWGDRALAALPASATRETLLGWALAATVALFLLTWAVGLGRAYAGMALGQRVMYDLAADLFGHLQRLSLRFHSRKAVGDSLRRVTGDCKSVTTIVNALLPVAASLLTLVSMFAVMWRLDRGLAALSLVVVPLMIARIELI